MLKVLFFKNFFQIGLRIQKFYLCFLETGAFLAADIAGILTESTSAGHLQIISGVSGRKKKCSSLLRKKCDVISQILKAALLSVDKCTSLAGRKGGNLLIDFPQSGKLLIGFCLMLLLSTTVLGPACGCILS